ncbi:DNA gyrase/topoisomerase IV subunit B [Candidatus Shikimatogenerans bostrichidophilus]|uniref:DNA gyrase/topoisomerase IV subunit B n=1 Tax=Candidatus Shikimatogenerans bostrichidophilus TaxID=2943807 RepID=UPI002966C1B1
MIKYTAKNIKYFNSIDHIRKRPSMYIGDVNINGLHHLFFELLDNSLDEFLEGYCNNIYVTINNDTTITIEDDGRGIPIDIYKKSKKTALEIVMTKIGAGGKFDNSSYKYSSGLHGVGLSCVNALSKKIIVEIYRNNLIYEQQYSKGYPLYNIKIKGKTNKRGTKIKYIIDDEIFIYKKYNYNIIYKHLKEISFINKKIKIFLCDKRYNIKKHFYYINGLIDYINYIDNKKYKLILNKDIYINKKLNNFYIEIIIRYNLSNKENIISYINNIKTINGGTHIIGFKKGLTKSFKNYIKKYNKKLYNLNISGKDIREGIISIISIKMINPQFQGQTKTSLVNKEIIGIVEKIIFYYFNKYLEENPKNRKKLIDKVIISFKYRKSALEARKLLYKNNNKYKNISGIPGKLSDCTYNDPNKCEIFLVEGDSAGGTAKQGRNRKFQAILPLKGKIINVEKSKINKILKNNEIKNIFLALGIYLENKNNKITLNIKKLKYKKIIIMTDADVDGKHITALILTFIFRYMKILINKGYIYIAKPPLYIIKKYKSKIYIWNEKDKIKYIKNNKNKKIYIQRYKGLGEMNSDQLWETTMNPKKRILKKVIIKNYKKSNKLFNILMGDKVKPRKKFIKKYSLLANLDI